MQTNVEDVYDGALFWSNSLCYSDSSSANNSWIPLTMTLTIIYRCQIRLVVLYFFMRRNLPFLCSGVWILSMKLFCTLTRFSC